MTWTRAVAALAVAIVATIEVGQAVRSLRRAGRAATPDKPAAPSRPEAEARLAEVERVEVFDPGRAVGQYQALLARVESSPELADLADRLREQRDRARRRRAEADLEAARASMVADPGRAIELCERVVQVVADLPPGTGAGLHEGAREVAARVAERSGVVLEPIVGQLRFGSPTEYAAELHPLLAEALGRRGYVDLAANSPFLALWEERAPYRLAAEVVESLGIYYLQSRNRISLIDASFVLRHAGSPRWQARLIVQTRSPMPNIPAYEAGRLATTTHHDPAIEHRLYKDAVACLLEKLAVKLRELPHRPG